MARKEKRIFEIQKKIDTWVNSKDGKECIYTKYLVYAPNLLDLLVKLSFDNSLNSQDISHINSAIRYFDSTFDYFPEEFLGVPGYLDDITALDGIFGVIGKTNATFDDIIRTPGQANPPAVQEGRAIAHGTTEGTI